MCLVSLGITAAFAPGSFCSSLPLARPQLVCVQSRLSGLGSDQLTDAYSTAPQCPTEAGEMVTGTTGTPRNAVPVLDPHAESVHGEAEPRPRISGPLLDTDARLHQYVLVPFLKLLLDKLGSIDLHARREWKPKHTQPLTCVRTGILSLDHSDPSW